MDSWPTRLVTSSSVGDGSSSSAALRTVQQRLSEHPNAQRAL
jgi:hypothetical protein